MTAECHWKTAPSVRASSLVVDVDGEGPLDRMSIRAPAEGRSAPHSISLAEQYLSFVEQARVLRLLELADYLVMAPGSPISPRLLLPEPPKGEEPSAADPRPRSPCACAGWKRSAPPPTSSARSGWGRTCSRAARRRDRGRQARLEAELYDLPRPMPSSGRSGCRGISRSATASSGHGSKRARRSGWSARPVTGPNSMATSTQYMASHGLLAREMRATVRASALSASHAGDGAGRDDRPPAGRVPRADPGAAPLGPAAGAALRQGCLMTVRRLNLMMSRPMVGRRPFRRHCAWSKRCCLPPQRRDGRSARPGHSRRHRDRAGAGPA